MTLYLEAKIHFFQRLFKYHRNFSNDFSAVRRNFSNEFCRMPFKKLSALLGLLLVFGKVEGILIIPLEKWKFVHKLR